MRYVIALLLLMITSVVEAQTYTVTFTGGSPATSHQVCVDASCSAASPPTVSIGPLAAGSYSITIKTFNGAAVTTSAVWPLTVSGGPTPPLVTDTFTDTNGTLLSAHTAADGTTWTKHSAYAGTASISSNQLAPAASTTSLYYTSAVPGSANYSVQATLNFATTTGGLVGPAGRISTSANTCYFLRVWSTANAFQLYKTVAGVHTLLGSWSVTPVVGTTAVLKLTMSGTRISGSYNGVERIVVTDSSITAVGRGGVRLNSGTVSARLDDLTVTVP